METARPFATERQVSNGARNETAIQAGHSSKGISAFPNVNPGEGMKESKDIQKPQNHANNHYGVQNRLDGRCHWHEAIHQPQQYTHHDQDFQQLN
jgi:hypothetical protein